MPVQMVDERLSSFEAKQQSREQRSHGGDYNNNPVDSLAAELILQHLAIRANPGGLLRPTHKTALVLVFLIGQRAIVRRTRTHLDLFMHFNGEANIIG